MFTALFVLVLALGFLAAGGGYVQQARRMRSYRSTRGRILTREVVTVPSGNTTEGRYGSGGGYMPRVTYRYTVDGVEHTGDRIGYAARGLKRQLAEQAAAAYPDDVEVWYDPAHPKEAWLERHSPTFGYAIVALGVVLVLGAGIGLVG